jgi:dihydroorotase
VSSLIVEGPLVDPDFGLQWGQVQIHEGLIARVGDLGLKAQLRFDERHLIFPGFVDVHTHLRQGDEHKEDFVTASAAALNGGITSMLDMPNNPTPPVRVEQLAGKRSACADLPVDIDFYLGVGPGTRPDHHPFYKAYMGPSIGPLFFHDDADLEQALRHYPGCRLSLHCEDPELLRHYQEEPLHEDQRPIAAEVEAVATALRLARKYEFFVHVVHLTSLDSLAQIEAYLATNPVLDLDSGLAAVVCEATPHHLYFDRENRQQAQRNEYLKMNPPLRSASHRRQLLQAFLHDRIDFLSTDHAPHTLAEKASSNPSGVPLLDTHGGFISWLLGQGMNALQVARHCCELPGKFMRRPIGRLKPGYAGDLAVLAPDHAWTVRAEDLHTKCGWSPFEGETFPGRVACTVAGGRVFLQGREAT